MTERKIIYQIFKSRYFIAVVLFIIWMSFFDPKDWGLITNRMTKLNGLHQSEQKLTEQIDDTKKELKLLKTNAHSIEKYAREKYYMKKDNEEIFILKDEEKK